MQGQTREACGGFSEWLNMLLEHNIEDVGEANAMLRAEGFDDCVVGVVERAGGGSPMLCYSLHKVIAKLMSDNGWDRQEAEDYFEFNQMSSWLGDGTPCYITPCDEPTDTDVEIARLKVALADAVCRPMGVVPDSAAGLITPEDLDDAKRRREEGVAWDAAIPERYVL
jgi:hypothetical protein